MVGNQFPLSAANGRKIARTIPRKPGRSGTGQAGESRTQASLNPFPIATNSDSARKTICTGGKSVRETVDLLRISPTQPGRHLFRPLVPWFFRALPAADREFHVWCLAELEAMSRVAPAPRPHAFTLGFSPDSRFLMETTLGTCWG